ncbi:hypothetical protein WR25_17251 [Diploscapter pachys]|uniref:PH domain-containing protein n=1 Tax=Diploscapter pachys TaxID=2018661 RepID=A0A2A2LA28_9BILA|nr:hypothetical protein WR25_17251 [Diploscapter pachys]
MQPRKTSSSKIGQIFESLHALATVGLFTEEEESNDKWNALAVDKLCRKLFPATFCILNFFYWAYYLTLNYWEKSIFIMLSISRRVIKEGWLLKNRDNFLPFPPFKSKWTRRYFVLRSHDFDREKHILDEYRNEEKTRLVGSWDLEMVSQEMNDWVNTICRVCGMAQEDRDRGPPYGPRLRLPNQANGNSLSSSPSFDSLIDAPSDVTSEDRRENSQPRSAPNYSNIKKFARNARLKPRDSGSRNHSDSIELPLPSSSASVCSSISSSHKTTEDDMSSISSHSGPPIPPRMRGRREFGLDQVVRSTVRESIDERADQESSGETIKTRVPSNSVSTPPNYAPSVSSSDIQYEIPISATLPSRSKPFMTGSFGSGRRAVSRDDALPPPVDRSSKPSKFRGDHEDLLYINSSAKKTSSLSRVPQNQFVPVPYPRQPPKSAGLVERRHLDYFEPKEIERTLRSGKSPTPSDVDYIRVDMDRTLAFKKTGHERKTTD